MKSYIQEDQYRVVGTTTATRQSQVTWYDTADQALAAAMRYDQAMVYRPDGSAIAALQGRAPTRTAPSKAMQASVDAALDLERDAALANVTPLEMRNRAMDEVVRFEATLRGRRHLSTEDYQRRDMLAAAMAKYQRDYQRLTNTRGMSSCDPEAAATDER